MAAKANQKPLTISHQLIPASFPYFLLFFDIFLGIQSLAQVVALSQEIKGSPATVMDNMSKSDLLNCQHSLTELILTGYAQKVVYRKSKIYVIFGYLTSKIP